MVERWNGLTKLKHAATTAASTVDGSFISTTRLGRVRDRKKDSGATWADCSAAKLQALISHVVNSGALVSFSRTTDGGVSVLYIKDEEEELKEYPKSTDDMDALLDELIEVYRR